MRGLVVAALVVGAGTAMAEPPRASCKAAASQLGIAIGTDAKVSGALAKHCEKDRWAADVQLCFAAVASSADATRCYDRLAKTQKKAIEGEADRLNDPSLSRWLFRRAPLVLASAKPASLVTLASLDTTVGAPDLAKARTLQTQGMTAYKAGKYDFAVKKFAAAIDVSPTPELVFHAAQAYRLKGDRAKALEHYEKYLELAPDGPAAHTCRLQVERLRAPGI